jgi:Flavodoxin
MARKKESRMRALVVYESMFGNTHTVAERIADGLRRRFDVTVVAVDKATADQMAQIDLLVVGGPTHVHGLSSERSRQGAHEVAEKEGSGLTMDPDADGAGLRDWFHGISDSHETAAAAFDTRIDAPAALTGRASKGIAKRLSRRGYRVVATPESFLVDKQNRLLPGEAARAVAWGAELAEVVG